MSRLRWPDSTNSVSEKPGTIHHSMVWVRGSNSMTLDRPSPEPWLSNNRIFPFGSNTGSCCFDHMPVMAHTNWPQSRSTIPMTSSR